MAAHECLSRWIPSASRERAATAEPQLQRDHWHWHGLDEQTEGTASLGPDNASCDQARHVVAALHSRCFESGISSTKIEASTGSSGCVSIRWTPPEVGGLELLERRNQPITVVLPSGPLCRVRPVMGYAGQGVVRWVTPDTQLRSGGVDRRFICSPSRCTQVRWTSLFFIMQIDSLSGSV